jgi:ribonuclease VapC
VSSGVVDSSILLALVNEETLEGNVADILPGVVIGAVNLAEVLTKVSELGLTQRASLNRLLSFMDGIVPFTEPQANRVGELRAATRHAGLSLGDRACLALALELGVPAYTTDRNWLRVDVGCTIHCLR